MKILRWTAVAITLAMGGAVGCSGSGCGGSSNSNTPAPQITCGANTTPVGGTCQKNTGVNSH